MSLGRYCQKKCQKFRGLEKRYKMGRSCRGIVVVSRSKGLKAYVHYEKLPTPFIHLSKKAMQGIDFLSIKMMTFRNRKIKKLVRELKLLLNDEKKCALFKDIRWVLKLD